MTGIGRALWRWLVGDRIRAGHADGAIFRLRPASVVVIAGRSLEIVRRRAPSSAIGPAVVYDCDSEHGVCQLRAELAASGPRLVLVDADGETPFVIDDAQLYLRRG